jgi:hypothetical protein
VADPPDNDAPPPEPPWWRGHTGAIITALAVVAAAAVAGYWPASASKEAAREETERLTDQRSEDARGAARILINELLIAGNEAKDLAYDALMRPLGPNFRITIPQADLRLVASKLDTPQWTKVNHALSDAANLERYLRLRSSRRHPLSGRPLSRHSVQILYDDLTSFGDAAGALVDLAKLTELAVPTFDPDEVFDRITRFAREEGLTVPL